MSSSLATGGPLVVFGQALGASDKHLVDAIRGWGRRQLAVSIMPCAAEEVLARKHELLNLLPEAKLDFFDATTHPLGSPDLRIPEEGENDH